MKNIIWVDKSIDVINDIYAESFASLEIKIHPFNNYNSAFDFLNDTQLKINLIVSNYCTFYWMDLYQKNLFTPHQSKICFNFFERIKKIFPELPFVLFSSLGEGDEETRVYTQLKSFHYISKLDPLALEKIKILVYEQNNQ